MSAPLTLIGKRFGRLVVLDYLGVKKRRTSWLCLCDCGTKKELSAGSLSQGTSSCGCLLREHVRRLDLTGRRFGRLTVLARLKSDSQRCYRWLCRCDCGTEKIIGVRNLMNGSTNSCGCLKSELLRNKIMVPNSCRVRGDKHPCWKGGKTTERHKIRNSEEYKNWRTSVFIRDNFFCQDCGAGGDLQAHHIKAFAEFPSLRFEISNGQTLCVPCHKKTPDYAVNKKYAT